VESIVRARLAEQEPFRADLEDQVSGFRATSVDGYKGEGTPIDCSFFVRDPDSRWVAQNLLEGMQPESLHGGVRVRVTTSAVLRVARFVVSLGGAAQPETTELASAVAELARGALAQAEEALASANEKQGHERTRNQRISQAPGEGPARPRSHV
jgi:hypothetical protein